MHSETSLLSGRQPQHRGLFIGLIIFTAFSFILAITFNALAAIPGGSGGLFYNNTGALSDFYYTTITPAGWTFSIWAFIYSWQAIWLIYSMTTICRRTPDGTYIYQTPVLPPLFYVMYIANQGFNIGWIFLWDRQELVWALVFIVMIPFTLYICLFISYKRLNEYGETLIKYGMRREIWLIRLLVQNGVTFYATWTTIASLINLTVVLVWKADVEQTTAGVIALVILSVEIVVYFLLETVFFDKWLRYTFSHYIVVVVALIGSLSQNYEEGSATTIYTIILIAIASVLALCKPIVMIWRTKTTPIFRSNATSTFRM